MENNKKELINSQLLNDTYHKDLLDLRADTSSKNRQLLNLTLQNSELKQLNDNLAAKQTKLIQQSTIESKKMMEELQSKRLHHLGDVRFW